jgi:VIT1/CCC1 family predicted Fe2+/Mn2+ transporter
MFNPVINALSVHWFSVQPCFNVVTRKGLSRIAKKALDSTQYYAEDIPDKAQPGRFALLKLGRRYQRAHRINATTYKPHKFWSRYMSRVASENYRGAWNGLAPLRFEFFNRPGGLLGLPPGFTLQAALPKPSLVAVRAFPRAYLCPLGWIVAINVEFRGEFSFAEAARLVEELRGRPDFLFQGRQTTVEEALRSMHDLVRDFVMEDRRKEDYSETEIYTVCSPLVFADQDLFNGVREELDMGQVTRLIANQEQFPNDRLCVTRRVQALTVTAFNRGTLVITRPPKGKDHAPACGLSNLEGLLQMTSMMQKYHAESKGYRSREVALMRDEVAATFKRLREAYKTAHFLDLCAEPGGHPGLLALLEPPAPPTTVERILLFLSENLSMILAYSFGVVFLAAILIVILFFPHPTGPQWRVFSVILALAAGGVASAFSGMMQLNLTLGKRLAIGATGALAVFVIVYFFVPALSK